MSDLDPSRECLIGLLTDEYFSNPSDFIRETSAAGHDFAVLPVAYPAVQRVLQHEKKTDLMTWEDRPVYSREDLILKSAEWSNITVGLLAKWLQIDSSDDYVRLHSELAFKQEVGWACHLGLYAVLLGELPPNVENVARLVNHQVQQMSYTQMWVKVTLSDKEDTSGKQSWRRWNRFRALTEYNKKIHATLELSAALPTDEKLLDRWLGEPVTSVIIPANIFISNAKGYPVLMKQHQAFVKKLMHKLRPNIIITLPETQIHPSATPESYQEYIRYLNRHLPDLDDVERFAVGYQDYLQAPLQPLMDNLDNGTYETFERDPIKYQQYEEAVCRALEDWPELAPGVDIEIMVVGAGRGPLVDCCLRAATKADRNVHVLALEKNPNAYVTLQNKKADQWHDAVDLVFADMRHWTPTKKCDILVSELLGSFGDNELSPECLDGAQRFLQPNGISIPAKYSAFIAPMVSSKLFNETAEYKDRAHLETPYVVKFEKTCDLAAPKKLWSFEHPQPQLPQPLLNNLHNTRYSTVTFDIQESSQVMHGLAGYFDAILYKDVTISIHPETHSPGMFSWFPIFFPVQTPVQVPQGSKVTVDFWRLTSHTKVWYEWSVSVSVDGDDTTILPIHNVGGRSYWVGL